ncbi:hypothetical protein F511_07430 [Dorcoceras hygrometricum]|uniref:Uncharacterized protein n=1 Tax=Dorcoceras hygrometricum TaxID=472368 RepID=A0A2Z7AVC6_9LAMI|nr:hypothetical protein F511_07430 [Dorcoceras hygrometricum]
MHEHEQQLRAFAPANNSLYKRYRVKELFERSPTLPQLSKTTVGIDGNLPMKLTVNSNQGLKNRERKSGNISLSMETGNPQRRPSLAIYITLNCCYQQERISIDKTSRSNSRRILHNKRPSTASSNNNKRDSNAKPKRRRNN